MTQCYFRVAGYMYNKWNQADWHHSAERFPLPASIELILRLYVFFMTFRGNGAFQLVNM